MYFDAYNLYGYAMSESLPNDEIKFDRKNFSKIILNTANNKDIDYYFEIDLKHPDEKREINSISISN